MYKLYDRVKLKDGRTGFICEIFENESDMLLDVELGNSKYDTICIIKDDIESKISK